jgi:predicted ABC-type ATPase
LERPSIVIVAGVNGCGKSTFALNAAGKEVLLGQTAINPDTLTLAVTEEFPRIGSSMMFSCFQTWAWSRRRLRSAWDGPRCG